MAFRDLREYMAFLEARGELLTIEKEVDPVHEIAAYIRKTSDTAGPAIHFKKVKGHHMPVAGGFFTTRDRAVEALGFTRENALDRFMEGIRNPIPPVEVKEAPCHEVVFTGEDVDLRQYPFPTYCALDGGAFITVACQISRDMETGRQNMGIYRQQLKGRNRLGLWASPYQHIMVHRDKAETRGEGLEVAVVQGLDPAVLLASQTRAPYGVDELGIAGGLRGEPVEVVRCKTIDVMVPAWAEMVFEGRLIPGHREPEGPFGEFPGYYGPTTNSPVLEITAVTMRRDAIWQAGLTGPPITENHVLKELPGEASMYHDLKQLFPEVRAVHLSASGCSRFTAYISAKIRYRHQSRCILTTALGCSAKPKIVILCDEDVDIYDETQVIWAVTTRCRPDEDVIIIKDNCLAGLDPSSDKGISSTMGIDATRPFGKPFAEIALVPGVEKVPDLKAMVKAQQEQARL
ncbi:MAG: UbiD family decarboxylase [Firmicutes bacterium]|nr:UbiD family decarboxylase [Bacillota bacterium]